LLLDTGYPQVGNMPAWKAPGRHQTPGWHHEGTKYRRCRR
jgi:hypothetical protein